MKNRIMRVLTEAMVATLKRPPFAAISLHHPESVHGFREMFATCIEVADQGSNRVSFDLDIDTEPGTQRSQGHL